MQKRHKKKKFNAHNINILRSIGGGNKVLCVERSFASLSQDRRNANRQAVQSQAKKQRKSEWQTYFLTRLPSAELANGWEMCYKCAVARVRVVAAGENL